MPNDLTPVPKHLAKLFKELDPSKPRVIFAIDATASREKTRDMASKLMAELFQAATANGGVELQLAYYRGQRECTASKWMSDAHSLTTVMSRVMCAAGLTQIERVLKHVEKEDQRQKVAAVILVSDSCEENPNDLYAAARKLNGVPVFLFQEDTDEVIASIYSRIATITGGAVAQFDAGAAARLAGLLRAVAIFATGGRKALANENSAAARLLLTQMKK